MLLLHRVCSCSLHWSLKPGNLGLKEGQRSAPHFQGSDSSWPQIVANPAKIASAIARLYHTSHDKVFALGKKAALFPFRRSKDINGDRHRRHTVTSCYLTQNSLPLSIPAFSIALDASRCKPSLAEAFDLCLSRLRVGAQPQSRRASPGGTADHRLSKSRCAAAAVQDEAERQAARCSDGVPERPRPALPWDRLGIRHL